MLNFKKNVIFYWSSLSAWDSDNWINALHGFFLKILSIEKNGSIVPGYPISLSSWLYFFIIKKHLQGIRPLGLNKSINNFFF
jgi:hypothetical protein